MVETLNVAGIPLAIVPRFTVVQYGRPGGPLDDWGVVEHQADGTLAPFLLEGHGSWAGALHEFHALLGARESAAIREAEARRCAAIPAPEGAVVLQHCDQWWRPSRGGGCPKCGAPGDVVTPQVRIHRPKGLKKTLWLYTEAGPVVVVHEALAAAGVITPDEVRAIEPRIATFPDTQRAVVEAALKARGWLARDAAKPAKKRGKK